MTSVAIGTHQGISYLAQRLGRYVLLLALSTLSACAALPPLQLKSPQLVVSDIEIADIGLNQIVFVVNVNADNPNTIEIPLSNVRFDLELLNGPFANGFVRHGLVSLPPLASRTIAVEFTVPTIRLVQLIRSFKTIEWTHLSYRLRGSANWGPDGIALPFDRSGDLNAVKQLVDIFAR